MPSTSPGTQTTPPASIAPSNTPQKKPRKVRQACERCRYRRIKCDGQVPACGNCSKVGAVCVDVDGHDAERRVVRGFSAANASARIAWLEDIIRTQLPHVNLDDGPRIPAIAGHDTTGAFDGGVGGDSTNTGFGHSPCVPGPPEIALHNGDFQASNNAPRINPNTYPPRGQKRQASNMDESSGRETSVEDDTRSVALDLGLLSLNSESRQVHYFGSSSGSLFASLCQAGKGDGNHIGISSRKGDPHHISGQLQEHQGGNDLDTTHFEEVRKALNGLYAQLKKDLPSRPECDMLLNRFFQHMHPNHPFLHRPSFHKIIDALYECASQSMDSPIQYNGWPSLMTPFDYNGEEYFSQGQRLIPISAHVAAFHLLVSLSIGATLQIKARKYTHNPSSFFKSAMSLAEHVFGTISLPVLQSVLLLIVHSLIDPEGSNVWVLTSLAMAHAIDLGLHREIGNSGKFSNVAIEMRRRIFFCTYTLNRSISTIQGRPLGLGDDTFDVNLPTMPSFDANMSPLEAADIATLPYSIQVFKMAQYISKIKFKFYRLHNDRPGGPSQHCLSMMQGQLREDLSQWLTESSATLAATAPSNQRLRLLTKLKIHYHAAMCLLHQPSQAIVRPSDQALQVCFESAAQRIRLYETLYESGTLCHSWRTVQDMFLAGATVMYCVSISSSVRRSVSMSSLARDFRSCSSMLSVGGEWWPIIRNARSSLERLASHTLELFSEKQQATFEDRGIVPPSQVGAVESIPTFPSNESFTSPEIEDALASVLTHDGQFTGIFDTAPMPGFMDEMPIYNREVFPQIDSFWSDFDETEFTNSTRQSRIDGRDLQDFLDNLGGQ